MKDIRILKAINENLEYNLSLFDKVGNLGMFKTATLIEARAGVGRSIEKVNRLIKQLEKDNGI